MNAPKEAIAPVSDQKSVSQKFWEHARVTAENIANTIREPLVALDNEQRVVTANYAFYETFHVNAEQTIGRLLYELGNGQWDIPELRRLLEDILPKNNPFFDFRVEHNFPDIGHKVMLLNARKLVQNQLHPEFILLALEDITERNQQQNALYESEQRYRLMVNEVEDYGIFMLDPVGSIKTWGEGAIRLTQYTEEDVMGKHFRLLYSESDQEKKKPERDRDISRRKGRVHDQGWRRKKNGTLFWADMVMTAMRNVNGDLIGFSLVAKDLTEEKGIAKERERLRELDLIQLALAKEQHISEVLQRSLLLTPPQETFPDLTVATRYQPAWDEANVGGDFLDTFALEDGKVALAVGDVAGKGLAAAARTAEVKFALRAYLRSETSEDLAQRMSRLNQFIMNFETLDHRNGNNFITLALAEVTPSTGETTVCLAGAEPPIVLRLNGEITEIPYGNLALGIQPNVTYPLTTTTLEHGDILAITTDGITEARQDRMLLGMPGFIRLVQEARTFPTLVEMSQAIVDAATDFSSGKLHDDACLLLARRA